MIIRATVRNSFEELGLPTDTNTIDNELDSANQEVMYVAAALQDSFLQVWDDHSPHRPPSDEIRMAMVTDAIRFATSHVIEQRYSQPIREKHRAEGANPLFDECLIVDGSLFNGSLD